MGAILIDGKAVAAKVNAETAERVQKLIRRGVTPALAVILVGDDPASQVYVGAKARKCAELGIRSEKIVLPKETTMEELLMRIRALNEDKSIHGILVQSPPPPQIDEAKVVEAILPSKDVDCFHAENVGKLLLGRKDGFAPCTPAGVLRLLAEYHVETAGKNVVVIGRSNIVGKPLCAMLVQKGPGANAVVTCVHSAAKDAAAYTRRADVVIAAVGKPEFVTGDMIKEGAAVIDVGINRVPDASASKGYRLLGDVKFDEVVEKAAYVTPVPGGVGPMTIAMLMANAVKAAENTLL